MKELQLSRFARSDFQKSDPAMVCLVEPRAAAKSKGWAHNASVHDNCRLLCLHIHLDESNG
eukprot:11159914-Prorocentrum_lima.AAC.1